MADRSPSKVHAAVFTARWPLRRRAETAPIADLEPVADATSSVPVVVLVPRAGFLGTGTTAVLLGRGKPGTAADLPRTRQARDRPLRLA
jgi:hypothetical protein